MKYMLLMQFSEQTVGRPAPIETWAPQEVQAHIDYHHSLNKELTEAGELVDALGLAFPDQARIVRAQNGGAHAVTDGPFPESKEFLAGFWIVDCESAERAIEIAARASAAPGPGGVALNMPIEVRPVMEGPAEEV